MCICVYCVFYVHTFFVILLIGLVFRDMEHANVLKMIGQCVEMSPFLTVLEPCPHVSVTCFADVILSTYTNVSALSTSFFHLV